ncbi:hypothetical protein Tco_0948671, partial [Tanacetum coccineum]
NCPAFYEDDDEEYTIAITPVLPTEKPDNSLSMGDEHLSTIPETESDELIKSSVENLVPIPSESEDLSDIESKCDVPVCDDFTTVSNPFFDADDDFSSSDDKSFSNEDVPKEIYSNPLFDEEIISTKIVTPLFATMLVQANQEEGSRRKQRKEAEVPQDETQHDDSVPTASNDPPLSGEDRMQLTELMILTTRLKRLRKVGKSFKDKDSLGAQEDASKHGRNFEDIDKDAEVSLVDEIQGRSDDAEMFDTDDLHGDEVIVDMAVGEKQEQKRVIVPDYEASRARGFVLRSLEHQSFA